MKENTRKKIKHIISFMLAAFLVFAAIPYSMLEHSVSAIDTSSSNEKALKEKIASYQEEEEAYKAKVEAAKSESKEQQAYKEDLDKQVTATQNEIVATEQLIAEYDIKITDKNAEIATLEQQIASKYAVMLERLRFTYEEGDASYLEMILDSESFTDFLMTIERVGCLLDFDRSLMSELQTSMKTLKDDRAILEETLASQQAAKTSLAEKEELMKNQIAETEAYIVQLQADQEAYEAEQARVAAAQNELDAELSALLAQRAKEQAAAAAAKSSGNTNNYPTGGSVYGDYSTSSNPSSSGFIWPVSSSYSTISSGYGARWGTTHLGIDIPASANSPVYAAAAGTVIIAKYHSSYGNYIVIDHGNGYSTLYAHNNYLSVSAGDTVSQGQVIAGIGSTGSSTGYHCHFEVRINGSTTDPSSYVSP